MTIQQANARFAGALKAKKMINTASPPLRWKIANAMQPGFIIGWLANKIASPVANKFGLVTLTNELRAVVINGDGARIDYGVISRRVVTTAFVNFMVDQLQAETSEWGDFKYHDSGVGTTAAAIGDTDIETTDGESRATGTQTEGASANIYSSVGTISYTSTLAITEHGLFSQATGGTLLDRHVFAAINVTSGNSIEFTYELTVNAGG